MSARHAGASRRAPRRTRAVTAVLVSAALIVAGFWAVHARHKATRSTGNAATALPAADSSTTPSTDASAGSATSSPSRAPDTSPEPSTVAPVSGDASSTKSDDNTAVTHEPKNQHRDKHAVTTEEGMWWGVDSSGPITADAIDNVRDWYRGGHKPQFWGRYVSGDYAVSAKELAYARQQGIYVYLLVNDANCSQCSGGGDVCGHDRTAAQARTDARDAIAAATKVGVGKRAILFKDIEQVASCSGEPTATYLDAWYHTLKNTDYRTGFYGNAYQQNFDFPRAYCAVVAKDPVFKEQVALDMNEDEPQLGAARGTVGPANAPKFNPLKPHCAPKHAVKIWQYGESTSRDNYTDIDQAKPDIDGLLAPDGGITGG